MDSDSSLTDLSSDLSSVKSLSPPPVDYPSPQSSQDHSTDGSSSPQGSRKRSRSANDSPPRKKRKSVEVKPRTTVHLDLRSPTHLDASDQTSQLNLLLKVLRKRRKIVVVAGAGISTSAGGRCRILLTFFFRALTLLFIVPDFRSSNGLFNTLKTDNKLKASGKHLFDASVYQTDSSTSSFHEMVSTLSKLVSDAKPTAFHEMLATLASEGRLMRLYTQNVDGIDTSLPPLVTNVPLEPKGPWPRTIQLHGSLEKMVCSKCSTLSKFEAALFNGPQPPPCQACVEHDKVRTDEAGKRSHGIGRLRPRMVLYNEGNPDEDAIGSVVTADLRSRPDAIIVVGTSLEIPGVKRIVREMCKVVRGRRDGVAVWINRGPPPVAKEFEDCWDLVVAGDCDKVALRANMRRWNDDGVDFKICTEAEAEQTKQEQGEIKVVVQSPKQNRFSSARSTTPEISNTPRRSNTPAMLTPAESPNSKATNLPKDLKVPLMKLCGDQGKLNSKGQLKAAPKGSASKPVSKVKSKNVGSSKASKASFTPMINHVLKISKPRQLPTTPKKAKALLDSIKDDPMPMGPISPQSFRSNGPPSTTSEAQSIDFKQQQQLSRIEILIEDHPPKNLEEGTISPTGTVPTGMGPLLS